MRVYPNKLKPIQYINHTPYLVFANYPIQKIKDVSLVKEWLGCTTAFRSDKQGIFIFCDEVEEVQWENVNTDDASTI